MNRHICDTLPRAWPRSRNVGSRSAAAVRTSFAALVLLAVAACYRPARVVWQQHFAADQTCSGASVATDARDVIVGTTCPGAQPDPVRTTWRLLRYDRNGKLVWQRDHVRNGQDSLVAIVVSADHDIIALGRSARPGSDSVLLRLAAFSDEGDPVWERSCALGARTVGAALILDSASRITVCGAVQAPGRTGGTDMLIARFDPDGNLLDHQKFDFGGDECGHDLVHDGTGATLFAVGRRILRSKVPDTLAARDIVLVRLDADRQLRWSGFFKSGGSDPVAQIAWLGSLTKLREGTGDFAWFGSRSGPVFVAATARTDSGVVTKLLTCNRDGELVREARYPATSDAACLDLAADRSGGVTGVGFTGTADSRHLLAWRYFRRDFTGILPGRSGSSADIPGQVTGLAIDDHGNALLAGVSVFGSQASISIAKIALPSYQGPPDLWLPNMHR